MRWIASLVVAAVAVATFAALKESPTAEFRGCTAVAAKGLGPASLRSEFPALTETRLSHMPEQLAEVPSARNSYPAAARLWGAFEDHAFWVLPARDCDGKPVACVLAARGPVLVTSVCARDRRRGHYATSAQEPSVIVGFAPLGTQSAEVTGSDGGGNVMVLAGAYASGALGAFPDDANAGIGKIRNVRYLKGKERGRYVGAFAVLDQSGRPEAFDEVVRKLRGRTYSGVGYADQTIVDLADAGSRLSKSEVLYPASGAERTSRAVSRRLGLPRRAKTADEERRLPSTIVIALAPR